MDRKRQSSTPDRSPPPNTGPTSPPSLGCFTANSVKVIPSPHGRIPHHPRPATRSRIERPDPGGPGLASGAIRSPPRHGSPDHLNLGHMNLVDRSRSRKRTAEDPGLRSKRSCHSNVGTGPASLQDLSNCCQHPSDPSMSTAPGARLFFHKAYPHSGYHGSDPNHVDGDLPEGNTSMIREPPTPAITHEQLVAEVKGIYAGLVMVEQKCVEITQERFKSKAKITHDQWQALIALHRTLLHEHHDFFLASQHPTASKPLRLLANKYSMPARMWRHGIHSFLELLRQQLPDSGEHMVAFVYIAYSMMALLKESVPSYLETWIECLGDLARYRMAIEETDMRDREIWSNVARTWYNEAADKSPDVGRIQHHLAVLARPNIVQQLFFYTKSLVSVVPFANARDSILLLFNPLLDKSDSVRDKYPLVESSLVTAEGALFTRKSMEIFYANAKFFIDGLDGHITRQRAHWLTQGPEIAASLIAGVVDSGNDDNVIWKMYQEHMAATKSRKAQLAHLSDMEAVNTCDSEALKFWDMSDLDDVDRAPVEVNVADTGYCSTEVSLCNLHLLRAAIQINANRVGDRHIVPFMSFILGFLRSLAYVGKPLIFIEAYVPWYSIVTFLNTLGRSGVSDERVEAAVFPEALSGSGRQLPEEFLARGNFWAQHVFPPDYFQHDITDEDERHLERASHIAPRNERCLFLGVQIAALGRYINYDTLTKRFSVTELALQLERESPPILQGLIRLASHTLAAQPYATPEGSGAETINTPTLSARTAETDPDYVMIAPDD